MLSSSIDQVVVTLAVAVVYLAVVRLVDVNEREPVWSLLLAFVLGGAGAGALNLGVDRLVLNLDTWRGAAFRELALFAALGATFAIFAELGRLRGWSEVTDLVDGLIYGAACGLGFTCGEAIANLEPAMPLAPASGTLLQMAGSSALAGLAQGVFGAMLGAGFSLATNRSSPGRWVWALVGLAAAVAAHGAHQVLAYGNALGGAEALWRSRLALALPLLGVAALALFGLRTERRVITRELAAEAAEGYVTADELTLLQRVGRRQLRYAALLGRARFGRLRATAALHNRQVMLALAKRRVTRAGDEAARARAGREVEALRQAIVATRARLPATPEQVA